MMGAWARVIVGFVPVVIQGRLACLLGRLAWCRHRDPPGRDVRLCSRGSACGAVRAARMACGEPAVLRLGPGRSGGLSAALRFRRAIGMLVINMLVTNIGWWDAGGTMVDA